MTLELTAAKALAALPGRKRPVLLVADRKTLGEMTKRAEIHPWVTGVLSLYNHKAWWNPQGYLFSAGEDFYVEKGAALLEADTSDEDLVARLGAAMGFTVPLIRLSPSIADDVFTFDHLKPVENGKFYVLHPVHTNYYVLAADYPQRVLVETHATFLKLAAALGAKSVKLTSVSTRESKRSGGLKVPVEQMNGVLGIKASVDETGRITYSHEKTFSKQMQQPYIPDELKSWVSTDTSLDTMAHLRLRNGITTDQVSISVAEKSGVNAELLAKVSDQEVSASAAYQAATTFAWNFAIEYHPM